MWKEVRIVLRVNSVRLWFMSKVYAGDGVLHKHPFHLVQFRYFVHASIYFLKTTVVCQLENPQLWYTDTPCYNFCNLVVKTL